MLEPQGGPPIPWVRSSIRYYYLMGANDPTRTATDSLGAVYRGNRGHGRLIEVAIVSIKP